MTNGWPFDRGMQRAMRIVRAIQRRRREPDAYCIVEERRAKLRLALNLHHDVHWTMYYFSRPLLRATRRAGEFLFAARSLEPEETFVDIGANFGLFTLQIARLQPQRRIVAVEPFPVIADSLERSIEANQFRHVSVLRTALAERVGEAELFVDQCNFGGHALRRRSSNNGEPVRVPMATFDAAIDSAGLTDGGSIGVVKIDVEGAESKVVAGMTGFLDQGHRPRIICEVRGPRPWRGAAGKPFDRTTAGQVISFLGGYGYRPYTLDPDGLPRPVEHERIRGLMDIALLPD